VNPVVQALVERVIRRTNREHAADAVLREELKGQRGLSEVEAAGASKLTFAYYRWRGWLDRRLGLRDQLNQAWELAARFARHPESFSDGELLEKAVPDWVRGEIEVTPGLARALQGEPLLWLRAKPGQGSALAKRLHHCRAFGEDAWSDTLAYQGREDLFKSAEFHEGAFEVQDVSSQAVGLLCAPQPGETWWDACAGEGGKLLHLSDLMRNQGLIWATDRAEWRLRKLKRRSARANVFNYRSAIWDGGQKLPTKTKFDGILVDAPCSGTGTWQRNPHARWTLEPRDIQELAELQLRLLSRAASALKPGGRLIYSVCSITASETTGVLRRLESGTHELVPLSLRNPFDSNAVASESVLLLPQQAGGNGMFVAGWMRKASKSAVP
jgi:16S rRNA (cytosine967-C5)-methyltransferase